MSAFPTILPLGTTPGSHDFECTLIPWCGMGVTAAKGCTFTDRDSVEVNFLSFFLKECHFVSPVCGCSERGVVSLAHIFMGHGQLLKMPLNP
jgi:hypothetical protein